MNFIDISSWQVVSGGQSYNDGQLHITDFYLER